MGKQSREQRRRRRGAERKLFPESARPDGARVREALRAAAREHVVFDKDAASYVRYMAAEYQRQLKEEEHTALPPSCSVMTVAGRGGEKTLVAYQFDGWGNTTEERHRLIYSKGGTFAGVEGLPIVVYFSAEAWGTTDSTFDGQTPLSEHPDKFEDVFFSATTADGRTARASFRISRGENKRMIPADEIDFISSVDPDQQVLAMYDALAEAFFAGWSDKMALAGTTFNSRN